LDVFYIGGTKCGALFGEALVLPDPTICPRLFSIIKCEGALVAKGFVLGVQFEALFKDGLYFEVGRAALEGASIIAKALEDAGIEQAIKSPTNQLFPVLTKEAAERLLEKLDMSFWDELDDGRVVLRIATSWATTKEEAEMAAHAIRSL
jgi:threonine aldolase